MAKIQNELKTILKALASLSKKVEKLVGQTSQATPTKAAAPAKKAAPKKAAAKKAAPKAKAKAEKKPAAKKPAAAKKEKESAQGNTVIDTVLSAVKGSKAGIKIADLKAKTGIGGRQLSNALYKLTKRNLIKTTDRGVYTAA
jgi:pyruvate/2-oxoglutarate dehydrogenase complex dihydrolipoamide acyltransferase (E2) component